MTSIVLRFRFNTIKQDYPKITGKCMTGVKNTKISYLNNKILFSSYFTGKPLMQPKCVIFYFCKYIVLISWYAAFSNPTCKHYL